MGTGVHCEVGNKTSNVFYIKSFSVSAESLITRITISNIIL